MLSIWPETFVTGVGVIRIAPMSAGDSSAEAPLLPLPLTPLLLVTEPVVEPADPDSATKTIKR
jgi:hypothetical protein